MKKHAQIMQLFLLLTATQVRTTWKKWWN